MKIRKNLTLLAGCLGLISACAVPPPSFGVPVNLVQNGSFEGGWQNGPAGWGWTYNVGVEFGVPYAADGGNLADVFGSIYQDLITVPGQLYHVQFALAGNFNITDVTTANILWGGNNIGSVNWNPSGHSINNPGWVWANIDILATAASTRFTIADSVESGSQILRVDAVSVTAVPDAASTAGLLALGLLGIFGVKRHLDKTRVRSPKIN